MHHFIEAESALFTFEQKKFETFESIIFHGATDFEVKSAVRCKSCGEIISSRFIKEHKLNHEGNSNNFISLFLFNMIESEFEFDILKNLINSVSNLGFGYR